MHRTKMPTQRQKGEMESEEPASEQGELVEGAVDVDRRAVPQGPWRLAARRGSCQWNARRRSLGPCAGYSVCHPERGPARLAAHRVSQLDLGRRAAGASSRRILPWIVATWTEATGAR